MAAFGEQARLAGRYDEALVWFDAALAASPAYRWVLARRGETYHTMGHHEEAVRDFTSCLELQPDNPWALAHRGAVFQSLRRLDEALADFNHALTLQPDYAWAVMQRSRSFEMLGFYHAGLADFQRAVTLDPSVVDEDLLTEAGLLHGLAQRYAESVAYYEQTLRRDPQNAFAQYGRLVVLCHWQGRSTVQEELIALRDRLLARTTHEPSCEVVWYSLAGLAALEDKRDEAFEHLTRALALRPARLEGTRHDLAWRPLHDDPRYHAVVARFGGDGRTHPEPTEPRQVG